MYVLFAVYALLASASAKDLIVGQEGGKLIFEQNVTASPTIWRQVRNLTVNASDYEVITRVIVIDNREDKNGEAEIVEGGEGYKTVTIQLKSPAVFRGYEFEVQVYAKTDDGAQVTIDNDQQNVQNPQQTNVQVPINNDQQNVQNPQEVGIDINGQSPNVEDFNKPRVTPVPTTSTTQESNGQDKVQHPVPVSKDDAQTARPHRDTQEQSSEQTPVQKTQPIPEEKPETLPEQKPVPVPEQKPETLPEQKPVPVPEQKPETLPEQKPVPVSEQKPETLPEQKPVPVPEQNGEQQTQQPIVPVVGKDETDQQKTNDGQVQQSNGFKPITNDGDWQAVIDDIFAENKANATEDKDEKDSGKKKQGLIGDLNDFGKDKVFVAPIDVPFEHVAVPTTETTERQQKPVNQDITNPQEVQQVKGLPLPYVKH